MQSKNINILYWHWKKKQALLKEFPMRERTIIKRWFVEKVYSHLEDNSSDSHLSDVYSVTTMFVLCDDQTIWAINLAANTPEWEEVKIPPIPQT